MLKPKSRRHEWLSLQKLVLCPAITTIEAYLEGVIKGEANARLTAISEPLEVPDIPYIQRIHREFFEHVHPWAGELNVKGDDIWFGDMLSCNPDMITDELNELSTNTKSLITDDPVAKARAIAFYHAKFKRIHPFKDGNGRVGRLLTESQIVALFGLPSSRREYTVREYFGALKRAQRQSNLRPLTNLVLGMAGQRELAKGYEPLPFRLRLRKGDHHQEQLRRRAAKNRN